MLRLINAKIVFVIALFLVASHLDSYEKKIALLSNPGFLGEHSFAYRIVKACENIGWQADVWDVNHLDNLKNEVYDFTLCLVPGGFRHPYGKTYLTIFHPLHHFFEENGYLKNEYRLYDGYLLTYPIKGEKKDFADEDKFPHLLWYPTVQSINFKVVNPKFLFYICCLWGNRREDLKYKKFLGYLEKQPYCRFYGRQEFKSIYPKSYKGPLSFESNELFEKLSDAGIALVLHSKDHLCYGLPSGRIFEAAASSAVIISDSNSFVKEQFGNSVLYIDVENSGKSIFEQVHKHVRWIYTHKTKALEMAKHAHKIFKEKFLLEDQLRRLGEFHKSQTTIRVPKEHDLKME